MTIKSQNLTDDEKNQIISRSTSEKAKIKEAKVVTNYAVVGFQPQTVATPVLTPGSRAHYLSPMMRYACQ